MKPFFLSTAIPYVNAPGHLGHALEFVQADVIARYQRILGNKIFFVTGTDENSLKNVKAAEEAGITTQELVDRNSEKFRELGGKLNISFDDFIRTTEERHVKGAQKLWLACKQDIYKKAYTGLYCVGCEVFYELDELENELCPEHHTKPEFVEEENYFFRLSKYTPQLLELIEKDKLHIIPSSRKNEILSFVKSGLKDICISRSAERAKGWGVPVPDDPTQIIWVWFDALPNYINALGYGENSSQFKEFWEGEGTRLHVIGKGIIRFHAVYWPAMLLSAELKLPNAIFVHGYLTIGGQKMSKSLGNVVDPFSLVEKYGTDAVRYFLLREIPPTEDGDFSFEKFEARYNSDLAGGLGNLVARVLALNPKSTPSSDGVPSRMTGQSPKFQTLLEQTRVDVSTALKSFQFSQALEAIWAVIHFCDKYIEEEKPWSFDPVQDKAKYQEVIGNLLFAIGEIANVLKPFLPETSEKIAKQLQQGKGESLFPRA